MMKKILKSLSSLNPTSITIGMSILVLILFSIGSSLLDRIELTTYDYRFLSRGIQKPSPEVVMAVIDEKSLDTLGKWPWPRAKIAELIDLLSQDGAKVIGFDIFFSEPDENSMLRLINELDQKIKDFQIENQQLIKFIGENKLKADNDLILANTLKNTKAKVVLGHFFHMAKETLGYEIDPEELDNRRQRISNSRYSLIHETQGAEIGFFLTDFTAYAPEGNLEKLSQATESSGYINTEPDQDGMLRRMFLIIKHGEDIYAPLAIQCVWQYLDKPQLLVKVANYGIQGIQLGERFIPTDEYGKLLVNFRGPEKTFPHYSISDIFNNKLPKGTFNNKIVLVGATAVGSGDLRNTPFSTAMEYPGMEVHATVMDNILREDFLYKPKWAMIYDLLAILILSVLTGIVLPRLSAIKGILFALGLFIIHILICILFFRFFGLWVTIVYPLLAILLMYTSLTLYYYLTEERERKKIKGAFNYYVSSSVVNEMLKDPERLRLGGDKKDLSVLFSDIRGFTTISEGLTPEELVHLMNEYLTVMTDIVFKYDGTLDKYMGDAIMALYGAPLDQPDHPSRACSSALEMMEGLKRLNNKWIEEGKKPLDIGIGINTGMMMVGNMGSDQRFDYTVIGDDVNLGSRLEGANKEYNTNILISESTFDRVKDEFYCMELDSVRVKGKTLPVRIFQLLGERGVYTINQEAINYFHRGLQFYKEQKWDNAIEVFNTVTAMVKDIHAAEIYIQRCLDLKSNPPPPGWDGVYTMTTK
jgi:adenylate cyclase